MMKEITEEIDLASIDILHELEADSNVVVVRATKHSLPDTIYDDCMGRSKPLAVKNTRPAFDAADFMRFGKALIGQPSNVTNMKGAEYLESVMPKGHSVKILEVDDPHAMHIDATILALQPGLLIYKPERVKEAVLREHNVLRDWELRAYPFAVQHREDPRLFMTSAWLVMNVLSIDERKVVMEENESEFAEWLRALENGTHLMSVSACQSIGGSSHCATVDLVRTDAQVQEKI